MFQYIFLVLVLTIASEASANGKRPLVNKPGTCVIEDTWHPVTGEKLGKRVRCGI